MLLKKLQQDLIEALKNKEVLRVSVLRLILSALNYEKIDKQHELNEEEVINVILRDGKKHRESIDSFRNANREDLWKKEEDELKIIQTYLPKQLSKEEVKEEVVKTLATLSKEDKKNFGKAMNAVMANLKGKAEGGQVSQIVKELNELA